MEKKYRVRIRSLMSSEKGSFCRVVMGTEEHHYEHEFEAKTEEEVPSLVEKHLGEKGERVVDTLPHDGPVCGTGAFIVVSMPA